MGLDYRGYAAYSIYFKMGWEMSPPQKSPFFVSFREKIEMRREKK